MAFRTGGDEFLIMGERTGDGDHVKDYKGHMEPGNETAFFGDQWKIVYRLHHEINYIVIEDGEIVDQVDFEIIYHQ